LEKFTPASVQALETWEISTPPGVNAELTKKVRVALLTLDALRPAGKAPRSNCRRPVFPPPIFTAVAVPKLEAVTLELI
jgi:hypothetical protein